MLINILLQALNTKCDHVGLKDSRNQKIVVRAICLDVVPQKLGLGAVSKA